MKPFTIKQRIILLVIKMIELLVNSTRLTPIFNAISKLVFGSFLGTKKVKQNEKSMFRNLRVAFIADGNRRFYRKFKTNKNEDFDKSSNRNIDSEISNDTNIINDISENFRNVSDKNPQKNHDSQNNSDEKQVLIHRTSNNCLDISDLPNKIENFDTKISEISEELKSKKGFEKILEIIKFCYENKLSEVSFFCFSIKNFQRPVGEIKEIMDFIRRRKEFAVSVPIKLNIYGNMDLLEKDVRDILEGWVAQNKNETGMIVNIFFSYSSSYDEMNGRTFDGNVDLLIRTSGVKRLSDFMVRQVSRGTAVDFIDPLWPEFSMIHLWLTLFKYILEERYLRD